MNDAIVTKYRPATDTRGARITASIDGFRSITVPYDYGASRIADAHAVAANALIAREGWPTVQLLSGHLPGGGYVFLLGGAA